jgi:hypothetical protein
MRGLLRCFRRALTLPPLVLLSDFLDRSVPPISRIASTDMSALLILLLPLGPTPADLDSLPLIILFRHLWCSLRLILFASVWVAGSGTSAAIVRGDVAIDHRFWARIRIGVRRFGFGIFDAVGVGSLSFKN